MKCDILAFSCLSGFRYSFEGVLQAIYGLDREPLDCSEDDPQACIFVDPKGMLRTMDVENAKFYIDFIVLAAFFVVLRIGCYFVLRWRVRVR